MLVYNISTKSARGSKKVMDESTRSSVHRLKKGLSKLGPKIKNKIVNISQLLFISKYYFQLLFPIIYINIYIISNYYFPLFISIFPNYLYQYFPIIIFFQILFPNIISNYLFPNYFFPNKDQKLKIRWSIFFIYEFIY